MSNIDPPAPRKHLAVIFDLDGTICEIEERRKHIVAPDTKPEGWRKDWKAFRAGIPNDTPNPAVRFVYRAISALIWQEMEAGTGQAPALIAVSGRYEEDREVTWEWLRRNGYELNHLFMRPDGDSREDSIIKEEIYRAHIEPHYDVIVVFDDRDRVVNMWRRIGLPCFQVADGDF